MKGRCNRIPDLMAITETKIGFEESSTKSHEANENTQCQPRKRCKSESLANIEIKHFTALHFFSHQKSLTAEKTIDTFSQ